MGATSASLFAIPVGVSACVVPGFVGCKWHQLQFVGLVWHQCVLQGAAHAMGDVVVIGSIEHERRGVHWRWSGVTHRNAAASLVAMQRHNLWPLCVVSHARSCVGDFGLWAVGLLMQPQGGTTIVLVPDCGVAMLVQHHVVVCHRLMATLHGQNGIAARTRLCAYPNPALPILSPLACRGGSVSTVMTTTTAMHTFRPRLLAGGSKCG